MSSSVQGFSSIFGPLLSPSQSGSAGLIAEQPDQAPAPTPQSSQGSDPGPQVSGSDQSNFSDALQRAGRNRKSERHAPKSASKPEKGQGKPAARSAHSKSSKHLTNSAGDPEHASHSEGPSRGPRATGDHAPASDSQNDTKRSETEAAGSHSYKPQITPEESAATPVSANPTKTQRPAQKSDPANTSETKGTNAKDAPTVAKAKVRAVKSTQDGADDADVSNEGPTDEDTNPAAQDALAAETDPGAAVAMGGGAGIAGPGVSGRSGGILFNDSPVGDSDTVSPADALTVANSGMDLMNGLASPAADPADDAAPSDKIADRPSAIEPQGDSPFSDALNAAGAKGPTADRTTTAPAEPMPEARFADVNNPKIVTGVRGELLPGGGTMHLRLDPPELGDLQISVHLRDGVMTAGFQTSNDQATRLLSHSLGNLKSMLEAQGVNVDKLHVQQGPKSNPGDSRDSRDGSRRDPTPEQRQSDRRDQQRKEIIQKMWDKLAGKAPVDLVA
jgi:flagellar hook-length control protein FliK